MIMDDMLRRLGHTRLGHTRLGNQQAIDNARVASAELSKRRVERESVEIYLQRHRARAGLPRDGRGEHEQHQVEAAT